MTWKITTIVKDTHIGAAMNAMAKYGKVQVDKVGGINAEEDPDELPVVTNGKGSAIISIGPDTPRKNSIADKLCTLVEKLEKEHGAHQVTRAVLNQAIRTAKMEESVISTGVTTAIAKGYLRQQK